MGYRKFKNRKCLIGASRYDSKAEAIRIEFLKKQQEAGKISNLQIKPKFYFPFKEGNIRYVNNERLGKEITYTPEASYILNGKLVVEDVKSEPTKTPEYKIKRALMKACHNIVVVEIEVKKGSSFGYYFITKPKNEPCSIIG